MYKSFKIRLNPTKEQEQLMYKHIGCCRFVWNYMIDIQKNRFNNNEKHLSNYGMSKILTQMKLDERYFWLNEVSRKSIEGTLLDLHRAYNDFFKKQKKYPKYKSKKNSKQNFPLRYDNTWFDDKCVHIEKIGKVRYVSREKLLLGRDIKIINPRVTYKNHRWILVFTVECDNQTPTLTNKPMGIDLGVKETMTVAFGDECIVFHNINKSKIIRNLNKRIIRLQRNINRKYNANKQNGKYVKTNNILKSEDKLRKLYTRVANIRLNYIHQSTHKLVSLLPCRVVMENLNVKGMMKNKYLSKAISEQCFYMIINQMRYKCEWNNIPFYQVDRFYPSSKTCSCCGCVKTKLTLKDRVFKCEDCGFVIDRDLNAAINLQKYIG